MVLCVVKAQAAQTTELDLERALQCEFESSLQISITRSLTSKAKPTPQVSTVACLDPTKLLHLLRLKC